MVRLKRVVDEMRPLWIPKSYRTKFYNSRHLMYSELLHFALSNMFSTPLGQSVIVAVFLILFSVSGVSVLSKMTLH